MFKRIIVATDLSSAAFAVVRNLGALKAYGAEECLLLQCLSLPQVGSVAMSYTYSVLNRNLEDQKEMLEKEGFKVETRIVPGMAGLEINRIAAEENYSLVVAGAESRTKLSEALLGGIAYEIIHRCRIPVFVARLEEIKVEGMSYIEAPRFNYNQHILFPTDFSETAKQAYTIIKDLSVSGAMKITLMHVQDQAKIEPHLLDRLDEFNEIDQARLDALKEDLHEISDVQVDTLLSYGNPAKEILTAIKDRQVQLAVMGSQGRGYIKELFLGSVSHNIVRMSEASVLLIPAKREKQNDFHGEELK